MKKIQYYISALLLMVVASMSLSSCSEDSLGPTIFPEVSDELDPNSYTYDLDKFLDEYYLKKYNLPWVIYSDSVTALAWLREKRCKTKIEWNASNQDLFLMVRKAEMWLHDNTWTTPIYKWDTKAWGEIPADFGRK